MWPVNVTLNVPHNLTLNATLNVTRTVSVNATENVTAVVALDVTVTVTLNVVRNVPLDARCLAAWLLPFSGCCGLANVLTTPSGSANGKCQCSRYKQMATQPAGRIHSMLSCVLVLGRLRGSMCCSVSV